MILPSSVRNIRRDTIIDITTEEIDSQSISYDVYLQYTMNYVSYI